jgi:hypothetical protein
MTWKSRCLVTLTLAAAAFAAAGCQPHIGDKCVLSTDCSVNGGRLCDLSQPGGYCTILNCGDNSCPDDAVCVVFQSSVPGCAYDDYQSPARTGRSFCMQHCSRDSDCRQDQGYVCRNPTEAPWNASVVDTNQSRGVCIVAPGLLADAAINYSAPVCNSTGADAAPMAPADGGEADAIAEGGAEGGPDAEPDARTGADAAGADAAEDAPSDAGAIDAPGGG